MVELTTDNRRDGGSLIDVFPSPGTKMETDVHS